MTRIKTVATVDGVLYGVRFAICANDEVIADRIKGYTEGVEVGQACGAAGRVLSAAGYDYYTVSSFSEYNGRRYQVLVEPQYFEAEVPSHGYVQLTWIRITRAFEVNLWPAEVLTKINAIVAEALAAMTAEVTETEPIEQD